MKTFIHNMFGELNPVGRFWVYIGLGTLAAAAAMSFDFGYGISIKHALFLAFLTVVVAFAPEVSYRQWNEGKKGVALALAALCVPLLGIELFTHVGYTAGLRGLNISETQVQNVKYDGAQDGVKEDKANLSLWENQLNTLLTANAWAASVKADALRDQMTVAQKEIDLETARGGCKAKCALRMKDKADLAERIGKVEQADDLNKRIEATKRKLDSARAAAAGVEHKSSAVEHQNKFLSKVVAMVSSGSLKASDFQEEGAQQTVNMAMALAGTGLPAFALFIAGLYRRTEDHTYTDTRGLNAKIPAQSPTSASLKPIVLHNTNTREVHEKHVLPDRYRRIMDAIEFAASNHRTA